MTTEAERWAFFATWFDTQASLTRHYTLFVYPESQEIEMIDNKNNRSFLRKTKTAIPVSSFFLGAQVNVLGRQLNLEEYADDATKKLLGSAQQSSGVVLSGSCLHDIGAPISFLVDSGFSLVRVQMLDISERLASFIATCEGLEGVPSGLAVVCEMKGPNAVSEVSAQMRAFSPDAYATATTDATSSFLDTVFSPKVKADAKISHDSSLCVIKPHAVRENVAGKIIHELQSNGLNITGLKSATLNRANAQEFLEVYKGVLPEYNQMVSELESGPCIAVEVSGADAHQRLRALCGPHDSELARHVRPQSLRAAFGTDKVQNAVHCTDLPDDTALELEYFFSLL